MWSAIRAPLPARPMTLQLRWHAAIIFTPYLFND